MFSTTSLVINEYAVSTNIEKYHRCNIKIKELQVTLLQMRRAEKDFLLYKKQKYADKMVELANVFSSNLTLFDKLSIKLSNISYINQELSFHVKVFLKIKKLIFEIGIDEEHGLKKRFVEDVYKLENILNSKRSTTTLITLLQLRRAEKDFFLSHDLKYLDTFNNIMATFSAEASTKEFYYFSSYHNTFMEIAKKMQQIGLNENLTLKAKMESSVHHIENAFSKEQATVINIINKEIDKLEKEQKIIYITFILLLIFLIYITFKQIYQSFSIVKRFFYNFKDTSERLDLESLYFTELQDIAQIVNDMISRRESAEKEASHETKILEEYKKVIDSSALVSKTDIKGIITYANKTFCDVSGYSYDELVGQSHNVIRHPSTPSSLFKKLWQTIESKQIFFGTIKNRAKNGKPYYVDVTIAPILNEDNIIEEYIAIRHNVTPLVEAKERADAAESAKDLFLSNMSHEIRTPLNAIRGFVNLLEPEMKSEKGLKYLNIVEESSDSLLSIVNDILDFAKIRSGNFAIDSHEFNIFESIESIFELFYAKAYDKSINFVTFIDPAFSKCLYADIQRIKQILINYLSNALKFTPDGGQIDVNITFDNHISYLNLAVKDSGIGIEEEKKYTIFRAFSQANDSTSRNYGGTGLGLSICKNLAILMGGDVGLTSTLGDGSTFTLSIPVKVCNEQSMATTALKTMKEMNVIFLSSTIYSKLLHRYFDVFGVEVLDKEEYKKISKPIYVFFDASNTPNEGIEEFVKSPFNLVAIVDKEYNISLLPNRCKVLTLPLTPLKIVDIMVDKISILDNVDKKEQFRFNGRILVAEDNSANQLLIDEMLNRYGIEYNIVDDGQEAMRLFKENSYDIVFMDNHMPNQDGITTIKKILEYEKDMGAKHTPIVMLSANVMQEDQEKFVAAGADDFLGKPMDINKFILILEKYLKHSVPKEVEQYDENRQKHIEHIERIVEILGIPATSIEKILKLYFEELPDILDVLDKAVEQIDYEKIEMASHTISGTSATYLLDNSKDIASKIEKASRKRKSNFNYKKEAKKLRDAVSQEKSMMVI